MKHGSIAFRLLLAAMLAGGCAQQVPPPPRTLAEYDRFDRSGIGHYPRQTIILHNLQRVLDKELDAAARVESLQVIARAGGEEPIVLDQLAAVLSDPSNPPELHKGVLEFLLKKDYPELAEYVIRVLPHAGGGTPPQSIAAGRGLQTQATAFGPSTPASGQIRQVLLAWLIRHPTPQVLSGVVRVWAEQLGRGAKDTAYYQEAVERITGKSWDAALLGAINTPGFTAPGQAMEILSRRLPASILAQRVSTISPKTEAVTAAQTFISRFDYLPVSAAELSAAIAMQRNRPALLGEVATLSGKWRSKYGYRFNIRDFHLLGGIARDSTKAQLDRAGLIGGLAEVLLKRRHIRYWAARSAREDVTLRFDRQVDRLTMADLWNLHLLNEMLCRPPVQAALRVMALQDRADRRNAWGGQVFYENGQASAKLYPADAQTGEDDFRYLPSARSVADGRDALCRFSAHFDMPQNAQRAGPDAEELADAREGNYYGLILTAVSETTFCAHYYNPQGVIVSLGEFPFGG